MMLFFSAKRLELIASRRVMLVQQQHPSLLVCIAQPLTQPEKNTLLYYDGDEFKLLLVMRLFRSPLADPMSTAISKRSLAFRYNRDVGHCLVQ